MTTEAKPEPSHEDSARLRLREAVDALIRAQQEVTDAGYALDAILADMRSR